MLRGNLESGPAFCYGKHRAQSSEAGPYALLSSLAFIALLPITVVAQGQGPAPTPGVNAPAVVYGGAVQAPLLFEGERVPNNQGGLSFGATSFYDDNVFQLNTHRDADEGLALNTRLDITRQSDRLAASFDYAPFFTIYRQLSQFDRVNHASDLNLVYKLTSRVALGVNNNFIYAEGSYPLLDQLPLLSGPPSPTASSPQILAYSTRTLSDACSKRTRHEGKRFKVLPGSSWSE